ncbi:ubiqutin family protein [Cryptosporidium ubiquitum]|uniref:Ubiqutin family protein n=1 Tax=Cryptosporidium ubiquitum TaxID=857276 RepID=A0A1J4MLV2_9CRYT|nr:ubiqutin family protein [Cryptosporidium ubiquitum]OII75158.1 ubiqutin family protein [Cryptosporidium ubiquitum]
MVNLNDEGINVNVKLLNGDIIKVPNKIDTKKTSVLKLKEIISSICNIPVFEIRLVWKDKILSNNALLCSYGIEDNSTLILARSPSRSSNSSSQRIGTSSSSSSNIQPESGGLFGDSNTDDFLSSALASPWIQSILNDPEIFRVMLESNPQLKALREQNPELNHIFNDPQFLQMSLDVLKNPELMKEMMRNSDRAISNIESIPGGFSALKRMYHTVQEPMWDAAMYNPNTNKTNTYNQYNIDKSSGPNSEALPNPWSGNKNPNNTDNINSSSSSETFGNFGPDISGRIQLPLNMFPFNFETMNPANNQSNGNFGSDNNNSDNMLTGFAGLGNFGGIPNLGNLANMGILNPNINQNNISESVTNTNNSNNSQTTSQLPNLMNLYSPFAASNPNTIQTVIDAMRNMDINNNNTFQNQISALFGNGATGANANANTNTNANGIIEDFSRGGNTSFGNLLNMINAGSSPINTNETGNQSNISNQVNASNNENDNGRQNYNYQLEVLSNMGFTDTEACIKALTESDGSINRAIDKLLNPN